MIKKRSILVHFSGGSDSTLTAALAAEEFDKVYLITYTRGSFIGIKDTEISFKKLVQVYGKNKFIKLKPCKIGRWYKKLAYQNYSKNVMKFKTANVCPCGPCKLSFHWHSIIYCLNNNIKFIADGTVPYMSIYPDQNKRIIGKVLKDFYKSFGIDYLNPVYNIGQNVEKVLYDKGISSLPLIRGTQEDRQVYCGEQVSFAFFVKYFKTTYGMEKYENSLSGLYKEKIDFMKKTVQEYIDNKKNSIIESMLGNDKKT
ncbi:hypothetical protein ISS07_04495 [Candidatus Woesearchaeota archaeon]|nr:hypothetical protein [Candidatus Woesearchaeota archaeon]